MRCRPVAIIVAAGKTLIRFRQEHTMSSRSAVKLIAGLVIVTAAVIVIVIAERPAATPTQRDTSPERKPATPKPRPMAAVRPESGQVRQAPDAPPVNAPSETANTGKRPAASVLDVGRPGPPEAAVRQPQSIAPDTPSLPPLTTFLASQCERVNAALGSEGETQYPRQDLLVTYGRSAAASGQFELAAAAYAMFLDEFGINHAYGPAVTEHLAVCLAPLDTSSAEILHAPEGPRYRPTWLMNQAASDDRLRQAIEVYTLLAEHAAQPDERGKALLAQGWVYRALNQWAESTAAWDRCAATAPGSRAAADALWLASQNLTYMDRPSDAANRLRRLLTRYPDDARAAIIHDQIEALDAESRRSAAWLAKPVESLESEIAARAGVRRPYQVYSSVVRWLQRKREDAALVEVCRWAAQQAAWPKAEWVACRFDLAEALLRGAADNASAKNEAARILGEIAAMDAPADAIAEAALRRARLFSELGDHAAAATTLSEMAARCEGNRQWEPTLLAELVAALARQGLQSEAREALARLKQKYPAYEPMPAPAGSSHPPAGGVP